MTTGNLAFPPQAGVLTIDVTQLANGQRTLSHIAINPATQNIQDVAAAITTGTAGLLQATVDPQNHTIQIAAQAGYGFDFSGRLPSAVTPVSVAGGTTARQPSAAPTPARPMTSIRFRSSGAGRTSKSAWHPT